MDYINGISYYLNKCQTLSNTLQMTFFLSGRQRIGAHALCVQHSATAAALSTSFLPNHAPFQRCLAERIHHKIRELYSSMSMSCESNRLKENKNRLVEFWQCTVIQHLSEKMRFSCFPALPGSAEAQVTWGGTVKRLLIAYFISNISAKKTSKCVHVCQSYSKPNMGRF